jgi:hypothetical protein
MFSPNASGVGASTPGHGLSAGVHMIGLHPSAALTPLA